MPKMMTEIGSRKLYMTNLGKRESATDLVIATIKRLLITRKLSAGDKLPSETELAQSLGVSRGSIREAMKILSAYGIVSVKQGDGTYIEDSTNGILFDPLLFKIIVNQKDFQELKELREMMEIGIINLAIKNAKDEDIKELENAYQFMAKNIKVGKYKDDLITESELIFHIALARATRNKLIQTFYKFIMDLFIPNLSKDVENCNFEVDALYTHRQIIDSIISRDYKKGVEAIRHSIEVWKSQTMGGER